MNPETIKEISDFLPISTKEMLLNPTASAVGQGIGGIFYFLFQWPIKLGIIKKAEFDDLAKRTAERLSRIPECDKDATKLELILKAIQESQYQLSQEKLRQMYANLMGSLADKRSNNFITPRYITIISQLGYNDALFLKYLSNQVEDIVYRVYGAIRNDKNTIVPTTNKFLVFNNGQLIIKDMAESINVLGSLGIIQQSVIEEQVEDVSSKLYIKSVSYIKNKYHQTNVNVMKIDIGITDFGKRFIDYVVK